MFCLFLSVYIVTSALKLAASYLDVCRSLGNFYEVSVCQILRITLVTKSALTVPRCSSLTESMLLVQKCCCSILPLWAGFRFHRLQLALSCASSLSCRQSVILSLVSSNQLCNIFFGLPLPFFPGSRRFNTVLTSESWRIIVP